FAMVAFPLGIRLHRGGQAVAAVGGIIVYLLHHVSQEGLSRVSILDRWGGDRWVPIMMFGLLGAVLLYLTVAPPRRAWRWGGARPFMLWPARRSSRRRSPRTKYAPETQRRGHLGSLIHFYPPPPFLLPLPYPPPVPPPTLL